MTFNDLQRKETKDIDAGRGKDETKERRAFRRRPLRARVYYQTDLLGMKPLIDATPVNISEDGICFKTARSLPPQALILVEIHHSTLQKPLKLHAAVVWVKAIDERSSHVGCRWRQRLNSSQLHRLL